MKTSLGSIFQELSPARPTKRRVAQSFANLKTSSFKRDTFSLSRAGKAALQDNSRSVSKSPDIFSQLAAFQRNLSGARAMPEALLPQVKEDDYEGMAKNAFTVIEKKISGFNEIFPGKLEKAGVPAGTEFEFDYDIMSRKATVTNISDESLRGAIEEALNSELGSAISFTGYASRVMNGYIASGYYAKMEHILAVGFGQDIKELYIDENGELCGMNEALQQAIENERAGKGFDYGSDHYHNSKNVEGVLKRLITDKNITPSVSHMGFGKNGLYACDGDIRIDKDFDTGMFKDSRLAMRGTCALNVAGNYDLWLDNEDKF